MPPKSQRPPKTFGNLRVWPSRLFASDGLLRPEGGPKITQEGPEMGAKRSPTRAQKGPRAAQEGPKRRLFGPRR
eukprot:4732149-Pyramimonas_sp.AAC.1